MMKYSKNGSSLHVSLVCGNVELGAQILGFRIQSSSFR